MFIFSKKFSLPVLFALSSFPLLGQNRTLDKSSFKTNHNQTESFDLETYDLEQARKNLAKDTQSLMTLVNEGNFNAHTVPTYSKMKYYVQAIADNVSDIHNNLSLWDYDGYCVDSQYIPLLFTNKVDCAANQGQWIVLYDSSYDYFVDYMSKIPMLVSENERFSFKLQQAFEGKDEQAEVRKLCAEIMENMERSKHQLQLRVDGKQDLE